MVSRPVIMSELCDSYAGASSRSNELDTLPLLHRRTLLLKAHSHHSHSEGDALHLTSAAAAAAAAAVNREECQQHSDGPVVAAPVLMLEDEHFHLQLDASRTEKNSPEPTSNGKTLELLDLGKVKVEPSDEFDLLSHYRTSSSASDAVSIEQNGKVQRDDGCSDELDHVPLIHRRKMLLASKQLLHMNDSNSCISHMYDNPSTIHHEVPVKEEEVHYDFPGIGKDSADYIAKRENEAVFPFFGESKIGKELHGSGKCHSSDTHGSSVTDMQSGTFVGLPCEDNRCSILPVCAEAKVAVSSEAQASEGTSSLKRKPSKLKRFSETDHASLNYFRNSTSATAVNVKTEPSDHSEVLDLRSETLGNFTSKPSTVKREDEAPNHLPEDKLDHMLLRERMNSITSHANSRSDHLKKFDWLSGDMPASGRIPSVLKFPKPISIRHPRKRRRTVTDSVETALEEDAPGLLRVLLDNGVSVGELRLYGDVENDDPLDKSTIEDGFTELEDIITKLFSQRQTILKIGLRKGKKDTKTTYCLACLFSLVEQARYLQFRKWPVEWGWCRELRSFIFVFQRHKRIVLERPEYGYATYFFELVDSMSITWQIKRLVIAMKLTSCSRISLIENRALAIGEDLTEGEGRVLMEYGWRPNSGLGTMLNYCDRVVHDRQKEMEKDTSDWRAKIGKLLMDGYSGGAIISSVILKKEMEHIDPETCAEVKLNS